MEIIEYKNAYKQDFIDLNIDWIKRFFVPEEADYEVLNQIESLLDSGSMIYFALEDNHVLATCMAMPLGDDVWKSASLLLPVSLPEKEPAALFSKPVWITP